MIKNVLFFLLGLLIGATALGVTFYIRNSNYYLDHPLFKTPCNTLKIRVHTICDSIQILNKSDSLLNQFSHLDRPDQLLISYERTKETNFLKVRAYCNHTTISIDSLFKNKSFEHIFIEENMILKDTLIKH